MFNISGHGVAMGPGAKQRVALVLASAVAVLGVVAASASAGTASPTPVKDNPRVVEGVPSSHGVWFAWVQNSQKTPRYKNFFVQRGTHAPIKVNAPRTEGFSGGIVEDHAFYIQQHYNHGPQLMRFDLHTGQRSALPPKVNHYRHRVHLPCCGQNDTKHPVLSEVRGDATVSGPWVLYSGYMSQLDGDQVCYYTVMLYNRVTREVRTIDAVDSYRDGNWAGQVNGRYATYWSFDAQGDGDVYRYDMKTRRTVRLPDASGVRWDSAVSSDGTVYYIQEPADVPADGPYTYELIRQPLGAPAEVVTTFTVEARTGPSETFVRDRANGSRVVFFSWKNDIYKFVDGSSTTSPR